MKRALPFVRRIRHTLKSKSSPAYARRMQMFFKAPVRAYGWRTAEVRKLAAGLRREISQTGDEKLLLAVAEKLFASPTLEEQGLAVFLLQPVVRRFGEAEFRRLERWLRWVNNWAACDALASWLLGPMVLAQPGRLRGVSRWAKSANNWGRRAAAVALIPAARKGIYPKQIFRLAARLLRDDDTMVQKGVGWLLKEAGETRPHEVVGFLLRVRKRAPRLALRTACEKLPAATRQRILA